MLITCGADGADLDVACCAAATAHLTNAAAASYACPNKAWGCVWRVGASDWTCRCKVNVVIMDQSL
jgi:hypothetical protein